MLTKTQKTIFLTLFIILSGCSEEIKTVEYYQKNIDERNNKISDCAKSAEKQLEPNCLNAITAESKDKETLLLGEGIKRTPLKN